MTTAQLQDAMAETYEEVAPQIRKVCSRFSRSRGLNYDDILSEAHEHFTEGFYKNDPSRHGQKGTLQGYLIYYIKMELLETARTAAQRNMRLKRNAINTDSVGREDDPPPFDFEEFTTGLSENAVVVLKLLLKSKEVAKRVQSKGGMWSPRTVKAVLKNCLRELGWTSREIASSFAEITQILS